MAFGKSGIRSMVALGTAYGVVAVLGLLVFASGFEPAARFTSSGFQGGLIAGLITTAGAWGIVFGNRYAKGGPTVVMRLVFAGAPVVNSFFVMWMNDVSWSSIDPRFWIGLLVIAVGGYLVLTNKPDH